MHNNNSVYKHRVIVAVFGAAYPSVFLVVATIPRSTHGATRRIVHHHGNHPIVPLTRIVLAHHAVARLGIPTDLHATHLVASHVRDALRTSDVPRGVPHGLGQVRIAVPSPEFFVVDKTLGDLVGGVQLAPFAGSPVLGEVLPLFGGIMLDASGIARIQ